MSLLKQLMFFGHIKRLSHVALAIISLTFFSPQVTADNTAEDFYIWSGMEMTGNLTENSAPLKNLKFKLFMQGRFGDNSSQFSQGLIRLGTGTAINKNAIVWLGYDWVPTSRPLAFRRAFNDHAIWQQLSLIKNITVGTVISRTRFEQHFFDIPGSTDVAHLFRQMFKLTTPISTITPKVSLVLWNEIFANLNSTDAGTQSGFNQNRAFVGIGHHLSKEITIEVGYMNQYINRNNTIRPNQMQHVLSVTLLLNF